MWYTHIDTPAVPPPSPAIIRQVSTPAPLPLPIAVQRAMVQQPRRIVTLGWPMRAAYAGRADLALAHIARLLGAKLVLKAPIKGYTVALFGDGTVKSFLTELANQLPSDLMVCVNMTNHQIVIKPLAAG